VSSPGSDPGTARKAAEQLDIGERDVGWDATFSTLAEIGFSGIQTSCAFAHQERGVSSARKLLQPIRPYRQRYP
jgi:myo-inositol catabolism protein IolH